MFRLNRYNLNYGGFGFCADDFGLSYMERNEAYWRHEQMRRLKLQARGNRRREVELEKLRRFVPAGPWDADCDAHPEQRYAWDMGAGFRGFIMRNLSKWTWCVYVDLPEWHPHRKEPYDFWNGQTAAAEILDIHPPRWAREFTYGGTEDCATGKPEVPGRYGIDHSWGRDRAPLAEPGQEGSSASCYYTTYEKAVEESWLLAAHFLDMVLDGTLPVPAEVLEANEEGILRIREQEMRIHANRRKERQQRKVAEAAAAEAARKAEEERAAAAAQAEAERLAAEAAWAAAAPQRRIRNILKTLREIDALEAAAAVGTLTADQQKKVARRAELLAEKAALERAA